MVHKLNDSWVLWYHSPIDNKWDINSYKMIKSVNTIEEFWSLYNFLNDDHVNYSMFFLMREGINPIWEDEHNKSGGCWSFKIAKKDVYKSWTELSIALLGEFITIDKTNSKEINGISISPKKTFSIVKIWNNNSKNHSYNILSKKIPYIYLNSSIYKAHISS
jgi:translation initiation factor 4E